MPLSDGPTPEVIEDRDRLRAALRAPVAEGGVPRKRSNRLLIASWNIRALGDYTDKWHSGARDRPKRDLRSLLFISEIISRFDLTAIQELKANTAALREILEYLNRGDHDRWKLLVTDVTRGDPGNSERLGFIYDTHKVDTSGLAAELLLPATDLIGSDASSVQFARTPYAVSFRSGSERFTLVTLHVVWGTLPGRTEELKAIAEWLAEWAADPHVWASDVIALGDFNIDRRDSKRWQAFVGTGLTLPWELFDARRSIFGSPGPSTHKYYDQIAWFASPSDGDAVFDGPPLSLRYTHKGGSFDFVPHVLADLTKMKKSHVISDHYPLWVEFARRND